MKNIAVKIHDVGSANMSDNELLSIVLHGDRYSDCDISSIILQESNNNFNNLARMTECQLMGIEGVGVVHSAKIMAIMEIAKRKSLQKMSYKTAIYNSKDIYEYMYPRLCDLVLEEVWVIYMNNQHIIMNTFMASRGGISETIIDPKVIMNKAISCLCNSLAIIHNHPSGNPFPGSCDDRVTQKIKQSCDILDIQFLDHVIIGDKSFYSYSDSKRL